MKSYHKFCFVFLIALIPSTYSQTLRAEYTASKLPNILYQSSPVYDGFESIYLFGGLHGINAKNIWRFNITSETIENLGELDQPGAMGQNGGILDSYGRIFYIGAPNENLDALVQILQPSSESTTTRVVATIPYGWSSGATIHLENDVIAMIGSNTDFNRQILAFDLKTLTHQILNQTYPYAMFHAAGARIGRRALILSRQKYLPAPSVFQVNLDTFEIEYPPEEFSYPDAWHYCSVVTDGKSYFVTGGYNGTEQNTLPTDGIVQFSSENWDYKFIQVENFIINATQRFENAPATVYVKKLNRLYFFGGMTTSIQNQQDYKFRDEIFYVDLDPMLSNE